MISQRRLAKPKSLLRAAETLAETVQLYRHDRVPECIEFRMFTVPLLSGLRAAYGVDSNLRALALMFYDELRRKIFERCYEWRHGRRIQKLCDEAEELARAE